MMNSVEKEVIDVLNIDNFLSFDLKKVTLCGSL